MMLVMSASSVSSAWPAAVMFFWRVSIHVPARGTTQLVEKFYYDNPEILNGVFSKPEYEEQTIKHFAEIVNPGGNRSCRPPCEVVN